MDSDKTTDKSPSTTSSNSPHLAFTAISNVKLHVPIQLSFSQPNYKKWSHLFLLLVRRFNLHGFLSGSKIPSSADDDEWFQLDAVLQGWILSTVTDEVSDLVISTSTASELWHMIHALFHDNKPARAMQLEHQFRTTVKGSMPMATYCQTLRNIADWLDDVDAPVSESQLVLQLLRGLPDDLQAQTSWMQFQQPQPNFLQVRSALLLLERQRTHSIETGTALLAGRTSGQPGTNQQHGRTGGMTELVAGRGYPGRGDYSIGEYILVWNKSTFLYVFRLVIIIFPSMVQFQSLYISNYGKSVSHSHIMEGTSRALPNTIRFVGLLGSHALGSNPRFTATAVDLGREFVRQKIRLTNGGGNVGLQGAVASTVYNNGGRVRGFILGYIATRGVCGPTYGAEYTVSSNYYKYFEMNHIVEAFIVLPGGIDTM
ncbi:unnamed protein product [Cuscuta campestris]|uniref:Cytokinin riboside 5'-monophosphate phosphoribohydrolase n=2 Tax=Cuscuta sect. Cleistogrammica TaxID=1824901 RepID=A0A484M8S4_9ASTE|nr:unnamed protein product [Cuscuta campestris]